MNAAAKDRAARRRIGWLLAGRKRLVVKRVLDRRPPRKDGRR
jgi:hypothetical protein